MTAHILEVQRKQMHITVCRDSEFLKYARSSGIFSSFEDPPGGLYRSRSPRGGTIWMTMIVLKTSLLIFGKLSKPPLVIFSKAKDETLERTIAANLLAIVPPGHR
ncbi:hypothetical protein MLD38_029353 [Melastoma candidum]|uniref:Uncharacterized protein n=1 Tax=Melastoma candidum TaxID=119954 RepID=A0ACB9N5B8_9MYRT|nr:hypothetical protein MLD38_029353 [Melastoma candidum]